MDFNVLAFVGLLCAILIFMLDAPAWIFFLAVLFAGGLAFLGDRAVGVRRRGRLVSFAKRLGFSYTPVGENVRFGPVVSAKSRNLLVGKHEGLSWRIAEDPYYDADRIEHRTVMDAKLSVPLFTLNRRGALSRFAQCLGFADVPVKDASFAKRFSVRGRSTDSLHELFEQVAPAFAEIPDVDFSVEALPGIVRFSWGSHVLTPEEVADWFGKVVPVAHALKRASRS